MECEDCNKNVALRRLCVRFAIVALEITCREGPCLVGEVISHPGAGTTNVPALTSDETNPSARSCWNAATTVPRARPYCAARFLVDGNRAPDFNLPSTIAERSSVYSQRHISWLLFLGLNTRS